MKESIQEYPYNRSVLEEPSISQFLEWNNIEEEDHKIIESFGEFPKEFFIDLKSFFDEMIAPEDQMKELKQRVRSIEKKINEVEDEYTKEVLQEKLNFYGALLLFFDKYGTKTSDNLIKTFAKRKNK